MTGGSSIKVTEIGKAMLEEYREEKARKDGAEMLRASSCYYHDRQSNTCRAEKYSSGLEIPNCLSCTDYRKIERRSNRQNEQMLDTPPIARSSDVVIDLTALCARMQSWARTEADAGILVQAIAEIKNLRVKSSAIEILKARVSSSLPPRVTIPATGVTPATPAISSGSCPSCGSPDYSSPTCYECEAVRSRRIIAKLRAILHRNKICERCGENLKTMANHDCVARSPVLSKETKKRFTKQNYLGNYNRDIRVLDIIDYLIASKQLIGNNVNLDVKIFDLKRKGVKIDIGFNDIVNPISNELHEGSMMSLFNHGLIVQPRGSTIEITEGGKLMLDEYRADHAAKNNSKCVKCGCDASKLEWDHLHDTHYPICNACAKVLATDVMDDMHASTGSIANIVTIAREGIASDVGGDIIASIPPVNRPWPTGNTPASRARKFIKKAKDTFKPGKT